MCRTWLKGQKCPFGDACSFAHGEVQLQKNLQELNEATAGNAGESEHSALESTKVGDVSRREDTESSDSDSTSFKSHPVTSHPVD